MKKKKIFLFLLLLSFAVYASPKDDFANVLSLAKYSACKDIAEELQKTPLLTNVAHPEYSPREGIPEGRGGSPQSKLKALSAGLFPWRFEVTNGYQEGFVYYALLGNASEQNGDILFAYRCYQNSLSCIDEDKSFDHPLPRAEIYLAIGRTCLAAGRYMDAKDWLDNAFLESGDNKTLQAAIDRILIQRANELGDYPEAIFLYQHLEQLAKSAKVGRCESGKVERITDHGLRTTDYANYAQILFYSRKDREGFSKLLAGISKLGIDNNLGVKDPLVDMFLNNIMRAGDDEVKWFYDLLGWAIVDARAKAGDENFLAFLCNVRTLFCKVYDFLNPKDDLKKVKERIDEVKRQLAQGCDVFGKDLKSVDRGPRFVNRKRKNPGIRRALREIINGKMEKTPDIILDDLLMLADWKLKHRNNQQAETNYFMAFQLATGTFANIEYDGTYAGNAAKIGMIQTKIKDQKTKDKFVFDNSFRSAETTLQLYLAATNDEKRAEYDTEAAMTILPKANLSILRFIQKEIFRNLKLYNFDKLLELYNNYNNRTAAMPANMRKKWCKVNAAVGNTEAAFQVLLDGMLNDNQYMFRLSFVDLCTENCGWGSDKDIEQFFYNAPSIAIYPVLYNPATGFMKIGNILNHLPKLKIKELEFRESIINKDVQTVQDIFTNKYFNAEQSGHLFSLSKMMFNIGNSNAAFDVALEAYNKRNTFTQRVGGAGMIYPVIETKIIEHSLQLAETNRIDKYADWLRKCEDHCNYRKDNDSLINIKESVFYKILVSKKNKHKKGE